MPFRTRRQKESAEKRRISFSNTGTVSYSAASEKLKVEKYNLRKGDGNQSIEKSYKYVRHEILQISALASLIILLQIVLKILNVTF